MPAKIKIQKTETKSGYDVLIGKGLINKIGDIIKDNLSIDCQGKGFLILIGEETARNYLDTIKNSLIKAGYSNFKSVIIGEEKIKSAPNLIPIIVGGNKFHHIQNVLRDYIYIPTTFLGMANNAVMGHPILTVSDINLLNTLDYKYFMSGYAEIAKHAIMKDPDFFEWLEAHGRSIFDGDESARLYAIKKSCQIKAEFMSNEDTKKLLGFGHLFGDAIQKNAVNGFLHGEILSVGMVAAFKMAHKMNMCDVEDYKKARRHLKSMSLPVDLHSEYWNAEKLVDAIDLTKPIILPMAIGQVVDCQKELFHKTLLHVAHEIIIE